MVRVDTGAGEIGGTYVGPVIAGAAEAVSDQGLKRGWGKLEDAADNVMDVIFGKKKDNVSPAPKYDDRVLSPLADRRMDAADVSALELIVQLKEEYGYDEELAEAIKLSVEARRNRKK